MRQVSEILVLAMQEAETHWKALRDRKQRHLSLEQATAYYYGRMMALKELIRILG